MAHRQNPVAQKTSVKHGKALNLPTNLEAFACLWLDSNVKKTEDNRQTEKALRQIINHLRIFDNVHECEKLIRQTKHEKVILIVSGQLAREIIPRTHGLVQLVACYIYCFNASDHEEWAKDYSKVSFNIDHLSIILIKNNHLDSRRLSGASRVPERYRS